MLPSDKRIAIVLSRFNAEITESLLVGAMGRLAECGYHATDINVVKVPGAIEIPLTAKLLAATNQYAAIICLGAVIRGETSHYDYVCQQVSYGCQQVMLTFDIPLIFGVLTTETMQQAIDRVTPPHHKGVEAVDAAIQMIEVVRQIRSK